MNNNLIMQPQKWITENGKEIQLTIEDVRKYFTDNPKVTDKECMSFLQICIAHRLDPWIKDAHLVKFKDYAAQLIIGKNAVLKIAHRNKAYNGFQAGIIVLDKNGKTIHREGTIVYDSERLIGGWAKVFRKDISTPFYEEVSLKEYNKQQAQWNTMNATMIRKVAIVHAHREAFPEDLNGIYDESEVDAIRNTAEGEKKSINDKINNIFGYKDDEVIEGEAEEITQEKQEKQEKTDILLNELKIYVKALKLTDEKINQLFEKHNVSSWEELTDEIKQKCIDKLKPKYEALKQKSNKTEEAVQKIFELPPENDPFNNKYMDK